MPNFAIEAYHASGSDDRLGEELVRARSAAAAEGVRVRHLGSVLLPGDEIAMHVFEGPSLEAVRNVLERADLEYERIVEATLHDPAGDGRPAFPTSQRQVHRKGVDRQ
jgi:hypothetical protein